MSTPRILKNFGVFVNGRGYFGEVDEVELPEIALKTEEHRGGGMDAPTEIDMGMEAMTAKLSFADMNPELLRLVGTMNSNALRIQIRGSYVRDSDNSRIRVIAELGGSFKKLMLGTWKSGDKSKQEYECRLNYFRFEVAGNTEIEIDVENMIRVIGGIDQLAGIRDDIGR